MKKAQPKEEAKVLPLLKRTKIFAYKGYVGIQSAPSVDGLIAKPGGGNIGVTVDAAFTDVSPEALNLLKKIQKVSGSFAPIMIFQAGDKMVCIGWQGTYITAFKPEDIRGDRDYNPGLLKASTEPIELPESFMEAIDKVLKEVS